MDPGSIVGGRYRLDELTGEGGMGRVFRATDLSTQSRVAVKLLGERGELDRFSVEAEALASVESDAIVRYIGHGSEPLPFLVMEWLAGSDLGVRIRRRGLSLRETLLLADRMNGALAHVHARGIVHRDLKPSNVVLPGDDVRSAKIVDFGIARVGSGRALTASGLRIGTLQYMAPEQYLNQRKVDGRADVFALGCILFECLTGVRALREVDDVVAFARLVLEEAPKVQWLRPEVPDEVAAFVARLLGRNPARRPVCGAGLAGEIARLLARVPDLPPPEEAREAAPATMAESVPDLSPPLLSPPPLSIAPRSRSLVGRDDLAGQALCLAREGKGPVLFWGPPGIGKTSVAIEVARRMGPLAAVVPLRAAADASDVWTSIAAVLCASPAAAAADGTLEAAVVRALATEPGLTLILDGAEHIAAEVAGVAQRIHQRSRAVRVFLTSRERVHGVRIVEVGGLATEAAVRLFEERAGRELEESERQLAERIVRILDGNPLAIELAAARVELLGLKALEARLARPLDALRDGTAHLTMDAAIAWSWDLLSADERVLLAACSIFRNSFTLPSAEVLLSGLTETPAPQGIASLRDKSLLSVAVDPGAPPRLYLSTPVRDFARAELDKLGLEKDLAVRHARHFAWTGFERAEAVRLSGDPDAFRELQLVPDDLIVAHENASSPDEALAALLALEPVRTTRGPFGDFAARLDRALARSPLPAPLEARGRQARGRMRTRLGHYADARVDLDHALGALFGDAAAEAAALLDKGVLHHALRDLPAAKQCYETVAASSTDSRFVEARALGNLGTLHHDAGRFDDAYACYVEAIALFESLHDPRPLGLFLANLAMLDRDRRRFSDAARRFGQAIHHLERSGDARLLGISLGSFGMLSLETGNAAQALAHHERACSLLAGSADSRSESLAWGRRAASLAALGRVDEAAVAFARAERLSRADSLATAVLRLFSAFLDVAHARVALAEGRTDDARSALVRANERAREARTGTPEEKPLLSHSDDARAALAALLPMLLPVGGAEQSGAAS